MAFGDQNKNPWLKKERQPSKLRTLFAYGPHAMIICAMFFMLGGKFESNIDAQVELKKDGADLSKDTFLLSRTLAFEEVVPKYTDAATQQKIAKGVALATVRLSIPQTHRSLLAAGILGPSREYQTKINAEIGAAYRGLNGEEANASKQAGQPVKGPSKS